MHTKEPLLRGFSTLRGKYLLWWQVTNCRGKNQVITFTLTCHGEIWVAVDVACYLKNKNKRTYKKEPPTPFVKVSLCNEKHAKSSCLPYIDGKTYPPLARGRARHRRNWKSIFKYNTHNMHTNAKCVNVNWAINRTNWTPFIISQCTIRKDKAFDSNRTLYWILCNPISL